jgi:hypothetical protein
VHIEPVDQVGQGEAPVDLRAGADDPDRDADAGGPVRNADQRSSCGAISRAEPSQPSGPFGIVQRRRDNLEDVAALHPGTPDPAGSPVIWAHLDHRRRAVRPVPCRCRGKADGNSEAKAFGKFGQCHRRRPEDDHWRRSSGSHTLAVSRQLRGVSDPEPAMS